MTDTIQDTGVNEDPITGVFYYHHALQLERPPQMMSTNPSHILIARNSRGHNNPSASLSSPTETHAAAAGIFRSSGSPPWLLEECDNDELVTELNLYESDQAIEIDDTFTRRNGRFPGTVKIVVESTTFWWVPPRCYPRNPCSWFHI